MSTLPCTIAMHPPRCPLFAVPSSGALYATGHQAQPYPPPSVIISFGLRLLIRFELVFALPDHPCNPCIRVACQVQVNHVNPVRCSASHPEAVPTGRSVARSYRGGWVDGLCWILSLDNLCREGLLYSQRVCWMGKQPMAV